MPKHLTLAAKLDRFPPVVVRLLARERKGTKTVALSDDQVSARSGLSVREVQYLSRLTSWGAVDFTTLHAFCRGCDVDLDSRDWLRKNAAYMASIRSIPRYLQQSPHYSSTFEPLMRIWIRHAA